MCNSYVRVLFVKLHISIGDGVRDMSALRQKKSKLLRDVKSSDTVLCQDSLMTVFYCLGVIESEA